MLFSRLLRGASVVRRLALCTSLAFCGSASAEIHFECAPERLAQLEQDLAPYLKSAGVRDALMTVTRGPTQLSYGLRDSAPAGDTVTLRFRPELEISEESVTLPTSKPDELRTVSTVSRKEILYALMHSGRETRFSGKACDAQALIDHVGVRQMTVAWAEHLQWGWPDGGPAQWNAALWDKGTPRPGVDTFDAFMDVFVNPQAYAVGCYTATKFVMVQGVLDYYRRIRKDEALARQVERRLWEDQDPLVGVEPRAMWSFEADYDASEQHIPGKYLRLQHNVVAGNFVPGDWAYFLNTDPVSYEKTGYEGSNAIYLGRNRFNDHYADNGGHYLYLEKLRMVYHWRRGVFSRSRDYAKLEQLPTQQLYALEKTPEEGGFLLSLRAVPYYFGFEELPSLKQP